MLVILKNFCNLTVRNFNKMCFSIRKPTLFFNKLIQMTIYVARGGHINKHHI